MSIMRYGPIQQAAKQLGSSHLRITQRGREGEKEERERGMAWSGEQKGKRKKFGASNVYGFAPYEKEQYSLSRLVARTFLAHQMPLQIRIESSLRELLGS